MTGLRVNKVASLGGVPEAAHLGARDAKARVAALEGRLHRRPTRRGRADAHVLVDDHGVGLRAIVHEWQH